MALSVSNEDNLGTLKAIFSKNKIVVLNIDLKKRATLLLDEDKTVSFEKGRYNISFSVGENYISVGGDGWSKRLPNYSLTKINNSERGLSFYSKNGKPIRIKLVEYLANKKQALNKIKQAADNFVKKNSMNWGEVKNIEYQNSHKRYLVEYGSVFNKQVGRDFLRCLFINENSLKVSIVPN